MPAAAVAALVGLVLAGLAVGATAKPVEEIIQVPVTVTDAYGKKISQPIVVTVFSDDQSARPMPVLVLQHGRAPDAEGRAALRRARYSANARWFASHGFLVVVPTRLGYGDTGGEDVEDSGGCGRKNYPPAYAAAAQQTVAVLDVVRRRSDVAPDRTVIVGQSFGGATAVALAAMNLSGVQATVNFAGGGGGNPKTMPRQPCGQPALQQLFRDYGKTARTPSLWIYSENDQYFGPTLPAQWFEAFREAGGVGEFTQFPPDGDDGHQLFTRSPQVWQARVLQFLQAHGHR